MPDDKSSDTDDKSNDALASTEPERKTSEGALVKAGPKQVRMSSNWAIQPKDGGPATGIKMEATYIDEEEMTKSGFVIGSMTMHVDPLSTLVEHGNPFQQKDQKEKTKKRKPRSDWSH